MSVEFELQKAVKSALDSAGIGCTVYDEVPQIADKPYARVGEITSIEWDDETLNGYETTVTLHFWSVYQGMKEVKDLMGAAKVALHNQPLTVTGYSTVLVMWEYAEATLDPDGETRHGILRFRVLLKGD